MKAEQLSIFLENRAGRLAEVTHTLASAGVNIRALSLADTSDFGILRMIVRDHAKAQTVLKEKGFTLGRTSVVAVEVPDAPGGLNAVLQLVSRHGINVEYMYALVQREPAKAVMIFRFDKIDQAIEALTAANFTIIPAAMLCAL
ncbi:MAG: amino acid-binding ACT domain protein [Candidatus Desulfovibrio kirbyi]|uniref:Amino acid-binding ACT domain protein n=1 Tax=Candidatus Desulfovibrio kirbyi TaxID=2696086 RepID=A0A6L2R5X1_9BACT|nr:MAG: amino acid-binding ACT domain protein [Candidatus Desulfovibrio kirbyi]